MTDILLATHNSEKYLPALLDSLRAQTCGDFRIIAGDDGSQDGTPDILRDYAKQFACGIEIVDTRGQCAGAKYNFFALLRHAHSEYVMLADHDDVWLPEKVQVTQSAMRDAETRYGKTPVLVHTDLRVVDEALREVSPSLVRAQKLTPWRVSFAGLLVQNQITGCTVMVNQALLRQIGEPDVGRVVMHDWWLALTAAAFGHIIFLDQATILYRQHGGNEVGAKDVASAEYVRARLADTGGIKKNLHDTYVQAGEFLRVNADKLTKQARLAAQAYSSFPQCGRLEKLRLARKYGLQKNTFIRKVGQALWG